MKTYPWIVKLGALALLLSISFGCKTYMKLKYKNYREFNEEIDNDLEKLGLRLFDKVEILIEKENIIYNSAIQTMEAHEE